MKSLAICFSLVSLIATIAQAKLLPYYHMDSYALMSDDVVLCDEESIQYLQTEHPNWKETKTVVLCKVVRSFKGDLKPGSEFSIEYGSDFERCSPNKLGGTETDSTGKVIRVVQPEYLPKGRALLFLKNGKDANTPMIVTSKLIQPDMVYEFVQFMNPGPLCTFPQSPENIKLPSDQKYNEAALIQDLLIALQKSALLKTP